MDRNCSAHRKSTSRGKQNKGHNDRKGKGFRGLGNTLHLFPGWTLCKVKSWCLKTHGNVFKVNTSDLKQKTRSSDISRRSFETGNTFSTYSPHGKTFFMQATFFFFFPNTAKARSLFLFFKETVSL